MKQPTTIKMQHHLEGGCDATTGQRWTMKRLREVFASYSDQKARLTCQDCQEIFEAKHS